MTHYMTNSILNLYDKHHATIGKYAYYLVCTGALILCISNFITWLVK